jgi:hypothetical protein
MILGMNLDLKSDKWFPDKNIFEIADSALFLHSNHCGKFSFTFAAYFRPEEVFYVFKIYLKLKNDLRTFFFYSGDDFKLRIGQVFPEKNVNEIVASAFF